MLPRVTAFLTSWQILAFIAAASVLPVLLCWRCLELSTIKFFSSMWFLKIGSWVSQLVVGEREAGGGTPAAANNCQVEQDRLPSETLELFLMLTILQLDDAKNELDGLLRHDVNTTEEEKTSLLQMFLTPNLQINASLCVFIWFVFSKTTNSQQWFIAAWWLSWVTTGRRKTWPILVQTTFLSVIFLLPSSRYLAGVFPLS